RKNLASLLGAEAVSPSGTDPWQAMLAAAESAWPEADSLINPHWVFPTGRWRHHRAVRACDATAPRGQAVRAAADHARRLPVRDGSTATGRPDPVPGLGRGTAENRL